MIHFSKENGERLSQIQSQDQKRRRERPFSGSRRLDSQSYDGISGGVGAGRADTDAKASIKHKRDSYSLLLPISMRGPDKLSIPNMSINNVVPMFIGHGFNDDSEKCDLYKGNF